MSTTVINTPGYYYSIAYFLAAFLVTGTSRTRENLKNWQRWLLSVFFGGLLIGFMELTDGIRQIFFIPCMAVSISLLLLYIYYSCDFGLGQAGYYCARAFVGGEFAASLCWQIHFYFRTMHAALPAWAGWKWIGMAVTYAIIFAIMYLVEKHLQSETEQISVNKRELLTVIIITLAVFGMSNISYLDPNTLFSSRFAVEMFAIRTLVDFSGLAVLYAYHIQVSELQMKFEVNTLQNILEMQYKNYQLSQENIELINQKYHDLKHQITLLKMEANTEKSTQYLEQMEKEIRSYEAQNKTGNKVLDAVLMTKSLYCQSKGIGLTCVADGSLLDGMAEMDISALFGNMLDNAIESVEKIEAPEKRLIHVSVAEQKSFLRIRVENYCEEEIVFKDGMPQTTKKDKRFHGFGMKSIRSTVEKYGGSVTAGVRNHWFELRILIPMENVKEE